VQRGAAGGRQLKFGETLAYLIESRGYKGNRQRICSAVGVSPAALSQYVSGQAKPGFERLLALAEFFNVSLDYLVYGDESAARSAAVDYGPLARYMDHSLAEVQNRIAAQTALVGRIGQLVARAVTTAAQDLAETAQPLAGMLSDDETLALEQYSLDTVIVTMDLQYDIIAIGDDETAGRFLPVVAANLARGRRYRFLLPQEARDWGQVVGTFRKLLAQQVDERTIQEFCHFRMARERVYAGMGLFKLDLDGLERNRPILFEIAQSYVVGDELGFVLPASSSQLGDSLMSEAHLTQAKLVVEKVWRGASPL
jgi:transcriptional regulator with XRE-family HTH domain